MNELPLKNDVMLTHFLKKFYTSLYNYAATGKSQYEDEINFHIQYLETIELENMANSHKRLYELVKKRRLKVTLWITHRSHFV